MRYIVSGYRRSGTSLMMHILKLLMPDVKLFQYGPKNFEKAQKILNRLNAPVQGYVPSPLPIMEIPGNSAKTPKFLRQVPDNTLIKLFFDALPYLPGRYGTGGGLCTESDPAYTIVYMRRNTAEIEKSLEKVAWHGAHIDKEDARVHLKYKTPFEVYDPYDQDNIDHVLSIVEHRDDIELWHVDFEQLTESPAETLSWLAARLNVPLNQEAVDLVKPELRRARV